MLGFFGLRVSHVLRVHLNSVARGGRGSRASGAYLSRVSVGESTRSSLRRIESESSLHSKEEETGSVKSASCVATTAGPTPAAGEDSARRIRARVSYIENSLQKSKGCDWLREASASIRQAGVHGGLAEAIAFANATRYRNGETAQWDGALAAKPTKAGQARDIGSTPDGARQTSQDGGRRNVPFRRKSCRIAERRGLHGPRRTALRRNFGVWAAEEGSSSWHIAEARQARQWFDDRRVTGKKKNETTRSSTTVTTAA